MLKEYLNREPGLSDLLNYAHVIDDGVILNKDGAFLTVYQFRGPDINSATTGELDMLSASFSRMLTQLEDGWMLHVDELRVPCLVYPDAGHFLTSVAALIDEERRQHYEANDTHYENDQYLTFVWKFPMSIIKTTRHWFIEGLKDGEDNQSLTQLLEIFKQKIETCLDLLNMQLKLSQLSTENLLSYLNTCITGEILPVSVPEKNCFIDVALSRKSVIGGYVPRIGDKKIVTLSLIGYLNQNTVPALLEKLGTYPMIYRWSNRFIPLSVDTAEREIKRYQKNWSNKVKGFWGTIKELIAGGVTEKINVDALQMRDETIAALTMNSNRSVRFGYWTSTVVLLHEDEEILEQATKNLRQYLHQQGFECLREDVNAFDAWLGSIPGHGSCNIRRFFLHSINVAHVLPLQSIWAGNVFSATSSLLPEKSPPVFYAETTGKTPFRFHLDVADVGHQTVIGPTGSGKSTYLDFLMTQFLRYKDAQIFVFDKDYSHVGVTAALEGCYYDIGSAEQPLFCPLEDLSDENKKLRAKQFIENLVMVQNTKLTPEILSSINDAVELLAHENHKNSRSLTVFQSQVQNKSVRSALSYYTINGQMKLLDATQDLLRKNYLQVFEMGWLLQQKPAIYLPILRHVFDKIEMQLDENHARKPTLIILEEAWLYIDHPIFSNKLIDWLKTLRKKNARVIFATQSLSDLYDPKTKTLTQVTASIMESCPTKIYLPNPKMETETQELYQKIGLNDRQIEIIQHIGIPKKHYYLSTPEGNRLIDLCLKDGHSKSLATAFLGLSKEKSDQLIQYKKHFGQEWVYHWLKDRNLETWANFWKKHHENIFCIV